ncbi:hypothetical protein SAY87_016007 [Trapa incisa]|uniref:Uncharacterized protein n=1 Tax=Trapa incisa TaxID=236973 RepID=A0AAN7LG69_9MYRT|nr:hypothetical protein SAY87_016007 [Trapa incisa]
MLNRGKAVNVYTTDASRRGRPFVDYYDYHDGGDNGDGGSPGIPCRKHPGTSPVGICALCLKDRLLKLVCSDCGEQRLSCCCSEELSSNRNSCTADAGSVGRVSFLIENEKGTAGEREPPNCSNLNISSKALGGGGGGCGCGQPPPERVVLLKRSCSSCVEIKKSNGIWKIGRLFRKKKQKELPDKNDSKSEIWVVDDGSQMGRGGGVAASRSRSLNSFRGFGVFGSEDDGDWSFSGARSSISGARASSVSGALLLDPDRKSGFSEAEPRRSTFSEAEPRRSGLSEGFLDGHEAYAAACNIKPNRRVSSLRESDFTDVDEKGFIDLKFFTPSSEAKSGDHHRPAGGGKAAGLLGSLKSASGSTKSMNGSFIRDGDHSSGSCRITVTEWVDKKRGGSRRSFRGWRWAFGQYHPNWLRSSSKKKDRDLEGLN